MFSVLHRLVVNTLKNNVNLKSVRSSQKFEFKTLRHLKAYLVTYLLTYLFTYLLTYLLTYSLHGTETFLRS